MKWYNLTYVNRRDWILENLENLNLTFEESVIVLVIDYMNSNNMEVTIEALQKKCQIEYEKVDEIISGLCNKNYLSFKTMDRKVVFELTGLFETDVAKEEVALNRSLFDLFENEFKRTLNQVETEKIGEWVKKYEKKKIINALRKASMYQKLSFPYIDEILVNEG